MSSLIFKQDLPTVEKRFQSCGTADEIVNNLRKGEIQEIAIFTNARLYEKHHACGATAARQIKLRKVEF